MASHAFAQSPTIPPPPTIGTPLDAPAPPPPPAPEPTLAAVRKDTSYWRKSFRAGANLSQASFSDNWKAGGVNNVAYTLLLQTKANYKHGNSSFDNEVDFQYGNVRNRGIGWRKSLDKLYIDSKYGYAISKDWSIYASLNVLSQFDLGRAYNFKTAAGKDSAANIVTSGFFAPGFITESVGFEYKPVDYFFIRFGTGTLRQTIVRSDVSKKFAATEAGKAASLYGVDAGKEYRNEVAFQILSGFEKEIMKNVFLKMRYIGFINYEKLGSIKQWDHRVEVGILAKVNKYISANVSGIMIYDYDADTDVQLSQVIGVGILYTVDNGGKK